MKNACLFLLCAGVLLSCNKESRTRSIDIEGNWDMINYVALTPSATVLNANDVLWQFNLSNHKLTVTNNVSTTYPYLLPSGIYDIEVTDSTVKIANVVYTYRFENALLRIELHPEVDGPSMQFKRK